MTKERTYGTGKRFIAGFMAILMIALIVPITVVYSEESGGFVSNRVADPGTLDGWKQFFGSQVPNTSHAGGVWVDKSVFTDASQFPSGAELDDPESFLVALSAIASNKSIVGYSNIPTDTMFVLDVSGSMEGNVDDLVDATNASIKSLLEINEHNRVGVVLYSTAATVILPLDRYSTTNTDGEFITYYEAVDYEFPFSGNGNGQGNNQYNRLNIDLNGDGKPDLNIDLDDDNEADININTDRDRHPELNIDTDGDNVADINFDINGDERADIFIAAANGLSGENTDSDDWGAKEEAGGTYIQGGIFKAYEQFANVPNTKIESGFQAGTTIMPIMVLMSDGAPTYGHSNYTNVGNNYNVGNGSTNNNDDLAFLTQLTNSYVRAKMEEKYGRTPLFYTLGLGVSGSEVATAVLDPVGITQEFWNDYAVLGDDAMWLQLPNNDWETIYANAYCHTADYVDGYYSASNAAQMIQQFANVVNEIIIQSRYYPTLINSNNPDLDGYITFVDYIGEYMEVKDIKGILLGDTLFTGEMLTSKMTSEDTGLGTVDNPTELGDEMIHAVMQRLGIDSLEEARTLVSDAWNYGQLSYSVDDDGNVSFSNYIGWYADAAGNYLGFWHDGMIAEDRPADAVYINRSYGFLGQAEGNIKDSDMMYMSVQVHTNIKSGHQQVIWKIPAALVPIVTYSVTLEGDSIDNARNIELEIIDAEPIRLLFETGLRSDINELNIAEIMSGAAEKHTTEDGYQFWTNGWTEVAGENSPYNDVATNVHLVPSLENERYYYTEDSTIYVFNEATDEYEKVVLSSASNFDANETYYHALTAFRHTDSASDGNAAEIYTVYEKISDASLEKKVKREDNTWYIPKGTILQETAEFQIPKTENKTESLGYVHIPFAVLTNTSYEAEYLLGNNGKLTVTPATGIKLTKLIDVVEPGASNEFNFRITLTAPAGTTLANEYDYVLANAGEYTGTEGKLTVSNGVIDTFISAGQTLYITGLPAGTTYTVEEIGDNEAYRFKSATLNGVYANSDKVSGTVAEQVIDDVEFVNTPVIGGHLVIDKTVDHPFGSDYQIPDDLEFNISVKLENSTESVANKTYSATTASGITTVTTDANGVFNVTLKHGEAISIQDIPEGTAYTVSEPASDLPAGFALDSELSSGLTGTINKYNTSSASLVNVYTPGKVTFPPDIDIIVTKLLAGREFKPTDSFEFVLERVGMVNRSSQIVDTVTVSGSAAINNKIITSLDISGENFDQIGTYHYAVIETDASENGSGIPGVTYDKTQFLFNVIVTDNDMDGELEIFDVTITPPTLLTGSATEGWEISATFQNTYVASGMASVVIDIEKLIDGPAQEYTGKNGFTFGLYQKDGVDPILTSTVTDVDGKASIRLNFPATLINTTYDLVLKEIIPENKIPGMTYSTEEVEIKIDVVDNFDGTVGTVINGTAANSVFARFTNTVDFASEAYVVLSGTKVLNGRLMNAGEFEFNLYETGSDYSITGIDPIKVTNAANGSFIFPMITYATVGTHYYVITETEGTLGGIKYDSAKYEVKVDVIEVQDNGGTYLESVVTVYKVTSESREEVENHAIIFTNTYTATPDKVTFEGNKVLIGRDLEEEEFEFELIDSDGNVIETVKNAVDGTFKFSEIIYDKAGVYSYKVVEKAGDLGGIKYDDTVYDITVTVIDNGIGQLNTSVSMVKGNLSADQIIFTNTYTAAPVKVQFEGIKKLEGNLDLEANDFEFRLTNTGNGRVLQTVYNDADGKFVFDERTLSAVDVYHYTITEVNTHKGGITYDTTVYEVTVTVTDNGDGELEASVVYHDGSEVVSKPEFVNTYKAGPVSVTLGGTKELDGRDLEEGEFEFQLIGSDEKVIETVENDSDGAFDFTNIEYKEAGVYTYTIVEKSGDVGGVTYDTTVYKVTVTVTDDGSGELKATVVYSDSEGTVTEVEFVNTYKADAIDVTLGGTKDLDGRDLEDGEFEFQLIGADGKVIETVENAADGTFGFTNIEYKEAGVYTYTIVEKSGDALGVTYDTTVYKVTVTVTDDGSGELKATVVYSDSEGTVTEVKFENTYEALELDVELGINKTVNNLSDEEIGKGGFNFALTLDGTVIDKVTTLDNGTAKFVLSYDESDIGKTYTYKISEINDGMANMEYSTDVYTFVVAVSLGDDGQLKATVTKINPDATVVAGSASADFVNTYHGIPAPGDATDLIPWIAMLVISGLAVVKIFTRNNKKQFDF